MLLDLHVHLLESSAQPPIPPTQVCSWKTHILDLVKIWYADGTHFWILIIEGIIELTGQMDLVPACNQISFEEASSCKRRNVREDSCSTSLLQIPWLGMTCCCCCCCFCGPLPIVPIPWCEISSISNWTTTATFRVRRLEFRRGSCSDSWRYLSFCLLIDAFFILGTLQTLAEKFLVSPEGTTLSNRISPGSRAAHFEKRNAHHTLAAILLCLIFPCDTQQIPTWHPRKFSFKENEFLPVLYIA